MTPRVSGKPEENDIQLLRVFTATSVEQDIKTVRFLFRIITVGRGDNKENDRSRTARLGRRVGVLVTGRDTLNEVSGACA